MRAPLIHQSVEFHAARDPNHPALVDGEITVTYGELRNAVDHLAALLQDNGHKPNERIGILIDNGVGGIIGLLGTLKADGTYVSVSPTFPAERIATMLRDAETRTILTTRENLELLRDIGQRLDLELTGTVFILESSPSQAPIDNSVLDELQSVFNQIKVVAPLTKSDLVPHPSMNTDEDLAYIMYTSGTTGTPKGVMVSHRNVRAYAEWAVDYFGFTPQDRFANHPRLAFDLCILNLFGAFYAGATICPVTRAGDQSFPAKFIREKKISVWVSVPSVISVIRRTGQLTPDCFKSFLRMSIFCGEALLPDQARSWREASPSAEIYNTYGPTEATVAVTAYRVPMDFDFENSKAIPIGKTNQGIASIYVLDEYGEPLPQGEIGRLVIGGSQVAVGYWKRPELTESKFLRNSFKRDLGTRMYDTGDLGYIDQNGDLIWLGRNDDQVKIMGRRVELGEIEAALLKSGILNEVCVSLQKDVLMVAAVRAKRASDLQQMEVEEKVLSDCEVALPSYMIPQTIHFLEDLPKNSNGKIDRRAVAALLAKEVTLS